MCFGKGRAPFWRGGSIDERAYGRAVFSGRNMVRLQEHRAARTFALLARLADVRHRLQAERKVMRDTTWLLKVD
jgi:hypothetical protein